MRMYPPGSNQPFNGTRLKRFLDWDGNMKRLDSVTKAIKYRDVLIK